MVVLDTLDVVVVETLQVSVVIAVHLEDTVQTVDNNMLVESEETVLVVI